MTRVTRAVGVVLLVLGGTGVGVAIGECIARITWREIPPPHRPPPPSGLRELTTTRELSLPGVRGVYSGAFYRNNSVGFRGPEYAIPKPPGVFRIVIAGDSVTLGSGVREEEAYASLVEQGLNARHPDRRHEVLNLGLIGLNIHRVLSRLETLGLRYDPDLIVYGCTLNDIDGPAYRKSMDAAFWVERARHGRFSQSPFYLLRVLGPRWLSLRELIHPRPGSYAFEILDNYLNNPPAWTEFVTGLDRLGAIARERDVPAIVFIHTWLEQLNVFHPHRQIYRKIGEAAEARGLTVIQSFSVFRGHDEGELWVSAVDGHPNAAGHRLLADALLAGLPR